MGNYTENLSKRLNHLGRKQKDGYCVICGEFGKLSVDHVPPKGAISITKTEQHLISELSNTNLEQKRGIVSQNGSKFKTICHKCNNDRIGGSDEEIKKTHNSINKQISKYYQGYSIYPFASTKFNVLRYARAMIGHILSATSTTECNNESIPSTYFDPLKDFVIHGNRKVFETHDFYYWFYPYERHLSAKLVSFFNDDHKSLLSLLAFHPIAFMITEKNKATYPAHSSKLNESDELFSINISTKNIKYATFPFIELEGNQFYMLTDYLCTTSRPFNK